LLRVHTHTHTHTNTQSLSLSLSLSLAVGPSPQVTNSSEIINTGRPLRHKLVPLVHLHRQNQGCRDLALERSDAVRRRRPFGPGNSSTRGRALICRWRVSFGHGGLGGVDGQGPGTFLGDGRGCGGCREGSERFRGGSPWSGSGTGGEERACCVCLCGG